MRTSKSFLLRLLTNSDEPESLRGMIHAVASGEEQSFSDGPALLALLRRMVNVTAQTTPRDLDTGEEDE